MFYGSCTRTLCDPLKLRLLRSRKQRVGCDIKLERLLSGLLKTLNNSTCTELIKKARRTLSQMWIAVSGGMVDKRYEYILRVGLENLSQWLTSLPTTPAPTAAMTSCEKHAIYVMIDIVMNALTCGRHNHCSKYTSGAHKTEIRIINY